jgi:hypothetical protein
VAGAINKFLSPNALNFFTSGIAFQAVAGCARDAPPVRYYFEKTSGDMNEESDDLDRDGDRAGRM